MYNMRLSQVNSICNGYLRGYKTMEILEEHTHSGEANADLKCTLITVSCGG